MTQVPGKSEEKLVQIISWKEQKKSKLSDYFPQKSQVLQ